MTTPPPYSVARPSFRFPALAARAGQAALGGPREVALAVFMAARLAESAGPGAPLAAAVRRARAAGARTWLASLTVPAATRGAVARVVDATADDDLPTLAAAMRELATAVAAVLDPASLAELAQVTAALVAAVDGERLAVAEHQAWPASGVSAAR